MLLLLSDMFSPNKYDACRAVSHYEPHYHNSPKFYYVMYIAEYYNVILN